MNYYSSVLLGWNKAITWSLIFAWLVGVLYFWAWWLEPTHQVTSFGFILNSLILAWGNFMLGYCYFFLLRMKKANPALKIPQNLRVAIVTTKAPSEPFEMVKRTLTGTLSQKYPHDTWVADESPTIEALAWYKKSGVKLSTREGVAKYHQPVWPRRTKCKEGNLAYFYDKFGYKNYDIVVQMDSDHIPGKGYLEHMLRPFSDPRVGYVAAPSVCDLNAKTSWAARARIYAEALFHGPIQSGSNDGWAPLCIGSHYALRTKALKQIGGLGPELAEDYSTTLMLSSCGWKGVWAYDAEAHGKGPNTFEDLLVQDYQWARSLIKLFISFFHKHLTRLSFRHKLQFFFTQLWYPVSAIIFLTSLSLAPIALITGEPIVSVNFLDFLAHIAPLVTFSIVILFWLKSHKLLRPTNAKVISWEVALFEMARWPWIFIAVIDAIISVVAHKTQDSRITPKGDPLAAGLPLGVFLPYLFLIFIFSLILTISSPSPATNGYYFFAIVGLLFYALLPFVVNTIHIVQVKLEGLNNQVRASFPLGFTSFLSIGIVIFTLSVHSQGLFQPNLPSLQKTYVSLSSLLLSHVKTSKAQTTQIVEPVESANLYKVASGDNLWKISKERLGDPKGWETLAKLNNLQNPALIHPGQELNLNIN